LLRAYVRYLPLAFGKEALWERVIDPYFAWNRYEFVASTVFGRRMRGDTRDILQQYVYYFGVWEPNLTRWIARTLGAGDTFVDVGANIGYFTLLASALVGREGVVVAVEPSPRLFGTLRETLALNRVGNARLVNMAALERQTRVSLYRGTENHSGLTTTREERGLEFECEVDAAPLSMILHQEEICSARMVKVDVEGAEWSAIQGMMPLLRDGRSDLEVIVEIDPELLSHDGRQPGDLIEFFADHGLHAYRIENDYSPSAYLGRTSARPPERLRSAVTGVSDVIFSRREAEQL
jgi:FkbM family methyltransferase